MTKKKTRSAHKVVARPGIKKPAPGYMRIAGRKENRKIEEPILKQPGVRVLGREKISPFTYARPLATEYQAAKAQYLPVSQFQTGFGIIPYEGMNYFYKEYRRNWLVRRGINILAFWVTKEGYETELELPTQGGDFADPQEQTALDPYQYLKGYVDGINADVNFDEVLRTATIKRSIYGHAAFEIDGGISNPSRLIPLDSAYIRPLIDSAWNLKGFSYQGKGDLRDPFYTPDEVLYFTLNDLEGDLQGLSDIEPILKACELHDKIVREDLTEALTIIWAGIALYLLDRSKLAGASDAAVQTIIDDFADQIRPGKSIVAENLWSATVVDIKPNLDQMLNVLDSQERAITGGLGIPKDMVGLKVQGWSRANAYTDLESFVDGAVTDAQRSMKRQVEAQWYEPLIRSKLGFQQGKYKFIKVGGRWRIWKNRRFRGQPLPVKLKHVWREPRTADWYELIKQVTGAYNGGTGWINVEKAYEIMMNGKGTDFSQEAYDRAHQLSLIDQPIPPAGPATTSPPMDQNPITPTETIPTPPKAPKGEIFLCDCCGVTLKRPARQLMLAEDQPVMVGPECLRHPDRFPCNRYKSMGVAKNGSKFHISYFASRQLKDREWKGGLRCGHCNKLMVDDDGTLLEAEYDYAPTLTPMPGDLIVCVACAKKAKQ